MVLPNRESESMPASPRVEPPVLTDVISNEDFLRMVFPHSNITMVRPEADMVNPEPVVPQDKVTLKGRSIATVDVKDGTTKLVIFHPTKATHKAVQTYMDICIDLSIEDRNGTFTPKRPQAIVDSVYESGNDTMIVTTENQQ
jgi:hypothetical protein